MQNLFMVSATGAGVEMTPYNLLERSSAPHITFLANDKSLSWDTTPIHKTFFDRIGPSTKCIPGPTPKFHPCTRSKDYGMIPFPGNYKPNYHKNCICDKSPFFCSNESGSHPPRLEMGCGDVVHNYTGLDLPDYLFVTSAEHARDRFGGMEFLSKRPILTSKIKSISADASYSPQSPSTSAPNNASSSFAARNERNDSSISNGSSSSNSGGMSGFEGLVRLYCLVLSGQSVEEGHCRSLLDVLKRENYFYNDKKFVKVWYNAHAPIAMPAYMNTLHNSILRSSLNKDQAAIFLYNSPYSDLYDLDDDGSSSKRSFNDMIVVGIVFLMFVSLMPFSFCFFPIDEKRSGFRHLQDVSGVHFLAYIFSNFFWDMMIYSIGMSLMFLILTFSMDRSEMSESTIATLVLVCYVYGFSAWMFIMVTCKVISDPNLAFTLYMLLSTLSLTLAVMLGFKNIINKIKPLASYDDEESDDEGFRGWYEYVFLYLDPCWSFGDTVVNVFLAQFLSDKYGRFLDDANVTTVAATDMVAQLKEMRGAWRQSLLLLFVCGVIYLVLLLGIDSGLFGKISKNLSKKSPHQVDSEQQLDSDVIEEKGRIFREKDNSGDLLIVNELVKVYDPPFWQSLRSFLSKTPAKKLVAVNGVSFGTRKGECFGLLGVNGAGKSTLFKMITGEICPTSGNAIVDGSSIMSNRSSALRKLGYCPQTEALCPLMNVQEHLFLFARLRGISFQNIKNVVEWGLRHMGLRNYSKQLPSKLSGGNRRKLQVTLAIIGNPQLICLDEPTTGVDPRARRYVWECISGSSTIDHGVLLTTHSMEESESLCHKLTIMLSGQLVCFGNLQHIKSKFSRGYTINLKMYNLTAEENKKAATEIDDFIASSFNDAVLTSKNFNVVQYQAPIKSSQLGSVFDKLSHGKNKKLFEDFSISQTTLEQVFLVFADVPRT